MTTREGVNDDVSHRSRLPESFAPFWIRMSTATPAGRAIAIAEFVFDNSP